MISEAEIQQVMRGTGMDYLQAMRHLQQRAQLAQMRVLYPLGKSQHL